MAFKFRSRSSKSNPKTTNGAINNIETPSGEIDDEDIVPKLTNAQLNKLTKVYPTWLRDNSSLKQLPGVYQGVLGQVQLQPNFNGESRLVNGQILANRQQQVDYMNRFTDTQRVHQLLSASQLSNETLATIWAHVNKTFPGKLTNREVCLALALIALFQQLETEQGNKDPFVSVKSEKKPPVPKLYPNHNSENRLSPSKKGQITASKSMPNELSSQNLLVDICGDDETTNHESLAKSQIGQTTTNCGLMKANNKMNGNLISLIDMDSDRFEIEFFQLTQTWYRFLCAMKAIFKRSFDILNVENSRQSSVEALTSPRGIKFIKHLSVCYPLAHNIKYKIDELKSMQFFEDSSRQNSGLFDKKYIMQIDDLMTSINEYWAVLINLFHESGQTEFIELIMDGLNYKDSTVTSKSLDQLVNEMNSIGRTDTCSICHTSFYLVSCNTQTKTLPEEDITLLTDNKLISTDGFFYYHTKCASFWLNQVDSSGLPFHKEPEEILSPVVQDHSDFTFEL